MAREKDIREFAAERPTFSLPILEGAHEVSALTFNPLTGSPRAVFVKNPPRADGTLIQKALQYVTGAKSSLGFEATDQSEFTPDPHVQRTSNGQQSIVHLHQRYRGIPIFQMTRSVQFDADETVERVVGDSTQVRTELNIVPNLDPVSAVRIASQYLSNNPEGSETDHWGQPLELPPVDTRDFQPRIIARFDSPSQPTTIAHGPFAEDIPLELNFFDVGNALRLVWNLTLTLPQHSAQYVMLVAADKTLQADPPVNEYVLYCMNSLPTATSVRGSVFQHNPNLTPRAPIVFPRPATDYPLSAGILPSPFPPAWWVTKDQTLGNCTVAVSGYTQSSFYGTVNNGALVFEPPDEGGDDQKVLNIFYFCNFMHDFLYMLGFDEDAGNFQLTNFTAKGSAGDPVVARAHPGPVNGTANMSTPPDGQSPTMNMGLVANSGLHTAFDSDVVFHEYCHGLSNRLVGGRMTTRPLLQPQSAAMGEGWSDYFALTIQNRGKSIEKTVTGDWVTGRAGGIRSAPYDQNYPGKLGDLGSGPYTEVHNVGEIWCAALMQMNRELGTFLGDKDEGHELGWRLVVDGMKLAPSNPTFLDGRDAILKALQGLSDGGQLSNVQYKGLWLAAWSAFARFGMGAKARCTDSRFGGNTGDSSLPQ
jgi:extracellular elastinolytic metalloproteinase